MEICQSPEEQPEKMLMNEGVRISVWVWGGNKWKKDERSSTVNAPSHPARVPRDMVSCRHRSYQKDPQLHNVITDHSFSLAPSASPTPHPFSTQISLHNLSARLTKPRKVRNVETSADRNTYVWWNTVTKTKRVERHRLQARAKLVSLRRLTCEGKRSGVSICRQSAPSSITPSVPNNQMNNRYSLQEVLLKKTIKALPFCSGSQGAELQLCGCVARRKFRMYVKMHLDGRSSPQPSESSTGLYSHKNNIFKNAFTAFGIALS